MPLFVFSENIRLFLARIKKEALTILNREVGLEVIKDRFIFGGKYHRLSLVLFEHNRMLGFYNPEKCEIGLNKKLMFTSSPLLLNNILRHEIGHMMAHMCHGTDGLGHGQTYRQVCAMYGWGDSVTSSTLDLEKEEQEALGRQGSEWVISKVRKLLALSSSKNKHEANLAILKANQILLNHNLKLLGEAGVGPDNTVYMKRLLTARRNSAKLMTISRILTTFLVSPVFSYGNRRLYLEVTGDRTNIEIAEHVAVFLERRLEELWQEERRNRAGAGGLVGRNSFMRGVAEGYLDKAERLKADYAPHESLALVVLESSLKNKLALVYGRLSSLRTKSSFCARSFRAGKEAGRNLSIKKQ
jgi:hypothetical protein